MFLNAIGLFETVRTVSSVGETNTATSYQFMDTKSDVSNTIYYRLKQIDMDGKYKYSPIVTINRMTFTRGGKIGIREIPAFQIS